MAKMICFDMDGTIADLFGVPGWAEKINSGDISPYVQALPLWDMEALNATLERLISIGWEIRVISWLSMRGTPEYNAKVRQAKLEWLERYHFPVKKAHLIAYGTTKANAVRKAAKGEICILVDDNRKVREGWTLGETINPLEVDDLPAYLMKYAGEEYDTRTPSEKLGCPFWV